MQQQPFKEIVPPSNSHQENRLFFVTIVVVIALAALSLWLTVDKQEKVNRLPNHLSNLATQLSIASDEIEMLQDIGMLSQVPTMVELREQQLAPFDSQDVIPANDNCFIVIQPQVVLRLVKFAGLDWQVQWRFEELMHDHQQDIKRAIDLAELCHNDGNWFSATQTTS